MSSKKVPWELWNEEMGDSKLSPELKEQIARYEERRHEKTSQQNLEELARQKEISDAAAEQYCWVNKEEYEYIEPRIGHVIHSTTFLHKLINECNLNCWYAAHPLPGRLKLVVPRQGIPETACWLQEGFQVEYSWMNFDEHNVPLAERRRGYRTVLLQLILKGILTEKLVEQVFGKATGPASERYNSLLYEYRNKKVKVKEE